MKISCPALADPEKALQPDSAWKYGFQLPLGCNMLNRMSSVSWNPVPGRRVEKRLLPGGSAAHNE
jgi:hypothetical protein